MLNNTPLKIQGYFYVIYSDDPEQNGWYVPDFGQLADVEGSVGLATGTWKLEQVAWLLAGHRRINREARNIWMKDLRTGLNRRDFLGFIYSTDFSALTALALTPFPHGAFSISNAVSGQMAATFPFLAGRDGGVCQVAVGLSDLATVAYDRPDGAWGASDVIVYDRQGAGDAPAGGPGATWIEVYGPDYAWSWVAATPTGADTPVFDNGLVRVRYDSANYDGFRVDVWNGSAYVEQGKMNVVRDGDANANDTWISANLMEYTPDRTVMKVVLANSTDAFSRESVFITMYRGQTSVTFEVYPALKSDGSISDVSLIWTPALNAGLPDQNVSAFKNDGQGTVTTSGTAIDVATAGTGAGTGHSGIYSASTVLGAANFTASENWVAILRCPTTYNVVGPYQTDLIVVTANPQASASALGSLAMAAYGTTTNYFAIASQARAGYVQVQVGFNTTVADQVMEAENMTLGSGTVTASDVSASGTGNNTTTATRTTDAIHVSRATWPNSNVAQYRVAARVKASAGSIVAYGKTGATTGLMASYASSSYGWLDLGDIATNGTTLEVHAWAQSTYAGAVLGDQPVSYWRLNETAGTTATDLVGSNPGTYTGGYALNQTALITNDTVAKSVALNGSTAYATIPNSGNLQISNAITLECWVKMGSSVVGIQEFVAKQLAYLLRNNSGSVQFVLFFGGVPVVINVPSQFVANTVYHVVGTYDGSIIRLFVNGSQVGFQAQTGPIDASIKPLDIGAADSAGEFFNGNIEEVAVYNYTLSPTKITAHRTAGVSSGSSAGTISVDRIESVMTQDRTRNGAIYTGARDQGQAALYDSRVEGCIVAR